MDLGGRSSRDGSCARGEAESAGMTAAGAKTGELKSIVVARATATAQVIAQF